MTQTYTSSAASILLAAMIVAVTWLPTISTPGNHPSAQLTAAQTTVPAHVILA